MKNSAIICLLFIFIFCSCSKDDNGIVDTTSTVNSGTATTMPDSSNGFSFNKKAWMYENNQLSWEQNIDLIDLSIRLTKGVTVPGNPPPPFDYSIIGSPIGVELNMGGATLRGILADSTKPSIQKLSENNIDNVNKAPTTNYSIELKSLELNTVYALKTQENKYAIIQFTQIDTLSNPVSYNFKWKYQTDGSPNFK